MLAPALIWILTAFAWLGAVVLIVGAYRYRIGALTERAVLAVIIALFGTVYSGVVLNTEVVHVFDGPTVAFIVRVFVALLLFVDCYWAVLFVSNRLGENGKGGPS
jgi:hypothetical protein